MISSACKSLDGENANVFVICLLSGTEAEGTYSDVERRGCWHFSDSAQAGHGVITGSLQGHHT